MGAHAALLADGTEVFVKIRRPGVFEQVEEDLEILQRLAAAATRHWEFASRYDLIGLAQEFRCMKMVFIKPNEQGVVLSFDANHRCDLCNLL